jgi:YVTN family beta-propeller protein
MRTTPKMSSVLTRTIRHTCAYAAIAALASLTACGGGGDGGNKAQPGSLQFSASTFAVNESAGTVTITVTRANGSDNAVSAAVTSTNGTATAGQDFTAVAATVNFAAGDAAAKTFTIPISNDLDTENDETFTIALSGATGGASIGTIATATVTIQDNDPAAPTVTRFPAATSSQPLALTANNAYLVVANPDNDSATFFEVHNDRNKKLAEIKVQAEPNGVAFLPDGKKAYVANTLAGTVSVIPTNLATPNAAPAISQASKHIPVGIEPYGLALTPNGSKLYVTNSRSNSISVIDTATDTVIKTINAVGFEPRGIAITNNGDGTDTDETIYVTQFLSLPIAGKADGRDDAKAGHVTVLSTNTDAVVSDIGIAPIPDTGFKALGDAIARRAPGDATNPANFSFVTGAYPNQLNNIAIKGGFAFIPNTGASPNGPFRFDVNTQSLLSVIDRTNARDANQTINMHLAVKAQTNPAKLFITQPWAMAFKNAADQAYVISAASNHVVKVQVNPTTGAATVQSDPGDATRVLQIKVGKNPRGIVVNSSDTRAYVMNYISRDVSIVNLTTAPESVTATMISAALPAAGSKEEKILIGKELYNTSIGVFDPAAGTTDAITGRMSNNGWGSCATCHTPNGWSDNVVWIFPSGPKKTISQHTDFDQTVADRSVQKVLNHSAERDEEEDFELNIRAVSGGQGLIVQADGITQEPAVQNLAPNASGGRNQLKVRGVPAWDALKTYMQFGIRAPKSPESAADPTVIGGRALFQAANCQSCHGGPQWTVSQVNFTPPPGAGVFDAKGQLPGFLRSVGTFDAGAENEVRQNAAAPLGADGYVPPSLLSISAFPQVFFHNGAATSLDQVMNNVTHRSAGTAGVDTLTNPADRTAVVKFLQSIDGTTAPVAP